MLAQGGRKALEVKEAKTREIRRENSSRNEIEDLGEREKSLRASLRILSRPKISFPRDEIPTGHNWGHFEIAIKKLCVCQKACQN